MIVLDASAAVDLLLRTPKGTAVAAHLRRDEVSSPELLDVEVCSALARLARAAEVTAEAADAAVRRLATMPVDRVSHANLSGAAWRLRDRVRITDAFYLACTAAFSATLLTSDARLARASLPGVSVTLVG